MPFTVSVGLPPYQGLRPSQHPMEDKKKKRSPKPCLTQPAQAPGTLRRVPVPTSHSGSLALGLPHLPSPKQRAKFKWWVQKGSRARREAPELRVESCREEGKGGFSLSF